MGRSPKRSSTQKSPRSIFDILHFVTIRTVQFFHWRLPDGNPDPRELAGDPIAAIAWRPEELRRYHDELAGRR